MLIKLVANLFNPFVELIVALCHFMFFFSVSRTNFTTCTYEILNLTSILTIGHSFVIFLKLYPSSIELYSKYLQLVSFRWLVPY